MADLTICELTKEHWDAICEVYEVASLVELERAGIDKSLFKPLHEEESRESFFKINRGAIGCIGSQVVAFVGWRDQGEWRNSGYLSYLYVVPAYHRHGIGKKLLCHAVPYLGEQAWTLVKPDNCAAISLYESAGMQIVNHQDMRCGVRMALPTSKKYDPGVPNFGTPYDDT